MVRATATRSASLDHVSGSDARYCPGCGGPAEDRTAGPCAYCGQPLLPLGTPDPRTSVRCPSCARAVAAGGTYCAHCGVALAASEAAAAVLSCPACARRDLDAPMTVHGLAPGRDRCAGDPVHGCTRCGGVWVPAATLRALIARARAEGVPGAPPPARGARVALDRPVEYRRCPQCGEMMLRRNFARISGVVTDTCREHGTFFDAGELEAVLDFVRGGGLAAAARAEAEEAARAARSRLGPTPAGGSAVPFGSAVPRGDDDPGIGGAVAGGVGLVAAFVSWSARWIRDRLDGDE